ncbi:uncharacterized protein [Temnothorax nylanderi]|uniref:uncharacterized protein n=1 Tax=Temnothorax nylanderi TaxID=102681 RepID=UPI003A8C5F50
MRPLFEDKMPIKTPEPSTVKPSLRLSLTLSPEVKVINMSSSDECIRKERDKEKPDESPVKKIEIGETALESTCPAENKKDVQVELPEKDMHVPHPSRDTTARVSHLIESTITPETDDGNNNLTSSENSKMIVEIDEKEVIITSKKRKISVRLSKQPSSQIDQKVYSTSVNTKTTSPMKRFSRSQSDSCLTSQEKTKCLDTPDAAAIRVDIHMNEFAQDETDPSRETRVSIDASAESSKTVSGPNDEDQSTEQSSKVRIYKNPQCKLLHMKLDDIHDLPLKNCTERLQKYQDLQNLYTERIASLTDLIEEVRNEQKDMDFSLISPNDNTSLMQISTPKSSCNDAQAVHRWIDPIEAIYALLARTFLESQRIMRGSEAASKNEALCDAEIQAITSTPRSKLVDTVKTHVQESKVVEGRAEPKIISNEKFNIHLSQVEMQQKPQAPSATKTSECDFYEVIEKVKYFLKQSENLGKASTAFVALKKKDETQHRVSSFKELDLKKSASLKHEKDDSITEEHASTSGTAKENDFIPILTEIPKISRSGNVTSTSARPKFPVISLNRLDRKKKEMDDLVMECLQEKKDGEKKKKKAASEESEDDEAEEKDGSEEEEEEEKKPAERNYIKKTPNKRKKESSSDEESASDDDTSDDDISIDDTSDDDTSDEEYSPKKSYYISKKSKLGEKRKKKGRGKNKKTPGSTAKKGDSDKDKGYSTGFTLSPELAAVVGVKQMRLSEVVSKIWSILKKRNLLDPEDKRYAFCDDELLKVFGEKRFLAFGMMKYLKNHMKQKHKLL